MNFEQPIIDNNSGKNEKENDTLEKEEKEFAEYIEKRIEFMKDLKPLLDIVRSDIVSPEARSKILEGLNYLGSVAYNKFDIDDNKKTSIEINTIRKIKLNKEKQTVNVLRTSGAMEDDWILGGINPESKTVRVHKTENNGQFVYKDIPIEEFKEWNGGNF
jgi:hypothetical protein